MVCYVVPAIASVIEYIRNRNVKHKTPHKNWLNLMFLGGTIFGIIDHLWNGELFFISANWTIDLALGFTITGGIIGSWCLILYTPRITNLMRNLSHRLGILR
jgi:hypothetical protein